METKGVGGGGGGRGNALVGMHGTKKAVIVK